VDSGQFDDLDGPAHSILFDDEEPQKPSASEPQKDPEPEQGKRNGE
jgi:nitrogen fixation-related uncharacterized protein